jgi:hypothetical protein
MDARYSFRILANLGIHGDRLAARTSLRLFTIPFQVERFTASASLV